MRCGAVRCGAVGGAVGGGALRGTQESFLYLTDLWFLGELSELGK